MWDEPNVVCPLDLIKVVFDINSRTVAIKVGNCQEMCNNSPAESI
jgi:hypothetical protein